MTDYQKKHFSERGSERGITRIKTIEFKYEWTIYNLNVCGKKYGEYIKSPSFPTNNDIKCFIMLYPNGQNIKDSIALYLYVSHKAAATFEFSILDNKGEQKKQKFTHTYEPYMGFGSGNFMQIALLPINNVTIICNVTIGTEIENLNNVDTTVVESTYNDHVKVCDDLGLLLESKELSDVVLIANGQEFQAHKAILAARSSVFLAMFKNEMKEKKESRVE